MSNPVSHGRGGAANITKDNTVYADGGIVREGVEGDQGDGIYSSGRGGAGNVGGKPIVGDGQPHDQEIIPETATRVEKQESHHYGRGGEGNVHHVHEKKEGGSLLDKAKRALHLDKK